MHLQPVSDLKRQPRVNSQALLLAEQACCRRAGSAWRCTSWCNSLQQWQHICLWQVGSRLSTADSTLKEAKIPDAHLPSRLDGKASAGTSGDPSAVLVASRLGPARASIGSTALPPGSSLQPAIGTLQGSQAMWHPLHKSAQGPFSTGQAARRLGTSLQSGWQGSPTCRTALITGCYICVAGLAVLIAPHTVFGLLFDSRYAQSSLALCMLASPHLLAFTWLQWQP